MKQLTLICSCGFSIHSNKEDEINEFAELYDNKKLTCPLCNQPFKKFQLKGIIRGGCNE